MIYQNSTEAFVDLGTQLLAAPEQSSRVGATKELILRTITIRHPELRCYVLPHRNDNIFAKIAETLWVMAGRNDIAFLSKYLPRAVDYSDDGKTWRAGYGQRMRRYGQEMAIPAPDDLLVRYSTDQLDSVVRCLQDDRYSRRAVMSLWDPCTDYNKTKDIPCNDWLDFIIRPNKDGIDELHLNIGQRSSDLMWGFSGINTFEFSILQTLLARWLQCKVGTLNYNITSLHVYERHYKRLADIVKAYTYQTIYSYGVPTVDSSPFTTYNTAMEGLHAFDRHLQDFFELEQHLPAKLFALPDTFLNRCLYMLQAYDLWCNYKPIIHSDLIDCLSDMPDDDFKLAAIEYVARDNRAILDEVTMSDAIMNALHGCMPALVDER